MRTRFAQLREWCDVWDSGTNLCCLKVTDDDIAGDEGEFDCATCPVAALLDTLDAENREAWELFATLYCRFAVDVPGVAGPVLARVLAERAARDATDLLDRLNIVYDCLVPPTPKST